MLLHTKTCTWIFIAARLVIAKYWREPKCPSMGEWLNKFSYIHAMDYYSEIKMNEVLVHITTWMHIKGFMFTEKKSISKVYMLYYSIYVIFVKWQNCRDGERGKGKEVGDTTEVTWESSFMTMEQFCIFIVIVTWIYIWDKIA